LSQDWGQVHFLFSKSQDYYYDRKAIVEAANSKTGARNRRTVWSLNTEPFADAHFATFPASLIEPPILAGTEPSDMVLDPFFGSGTVGEVCLRLKRRFVGIELKPDYAEIAAKRVHWQKSEGGGNRTDGLSRPEAKRTNRLPRTSPGGQRTMPFGGIEEHQSMIKPSISSSSSSRQGFARKSSAPL
jgi:DNA modification methylase